MTEDTARLLAIKAAERAGSQRALSKLIGVSEGYLSEMLSGRRPMSEELLTHIGLKAVVTYKKIDA